VGGNDPSYQKERKGKEEGGEFKIRGQRLESRKGPSPISSWLNPTEIHLNVGGRKKEKKEESA